MTKLCGCHVLNVTIDSKSQVKFLNYIVEFNTIALLDYFPGKTGFTMQIFDRICLKFLSVYMLSLFGHYYHELLIGAHLTDTNASLYSPHTAINLQLRNGSRNDRIMTILSYM
jgi:hypothetical protein